MSAVPSGALFLSQHSGDPDSPDDPSLHTVGELQTALGITSTSVSAITSGVVSTAASGALNSVPVSTADSKAVSAATRASVADSKALSDSSNSSTADSKALSVSVNTSIADSKAVSVATATPIVTAVVYSTNISAADSKAVSNAVALSARGINLSDSPYLIVNDGGSSTPTDNYAAFAAAVAALPITGGKIEIPAGKYYLSQTLRLTKPIHLVGAGKGEPIGAPGTNTMATTLFFAADKTGIQVESYTSNLDTTEADRGSAGTYSIIEGMTIVSKGGQTGLLNGGTGAVCHGVRFRTTAIARDLWIDGFKGNGVRVWATAGSGDGTLVGNANLSELTQITVNRCGSDGFSIFGTDVNVMTIEKCNSSVNTGCGFYDGGFLGNTYISCHTLGNGDCCFKADNVNAGHVFAGCYAEGGSVTASLTSACIVIGNLLSQDTLLDPATTALVIGPSGILSRGSLKHRNSRGTKTVQIELGHPDTSQQVITFGSTDSSPGTYNDWAFTYNQFADNYWWWTNANSSSRLALGLPDGSLGATLRAFAPAVRNGIFIGAAVTAPGTYFNVGNAAPSTGTWVRGDRQLNSQVLQAASTGIEYWKCDTAGTPGTWTANRAFGTVTLGAAASTVVSNVNVQAGSRIFITPTNAAAGTLQAGANAVYVSAKTGGTSFTLTTAGGGAAGGTETFDYVIFN